MLLSILIFRKGEWRLHWVETQMIHLVKSVLAITEANNITSQYLLKDSKWHSIEQILEEERSCHKKSKKMFLPKES